MQDAATFLVALAALVTSAGGLLKVWYDLRKVHRIVNSQRTAMLATIDELRDLLSASRARESPPK